MTPSPDSPRYEPDRRSRKVMGPLFGAACLVATSTGVVVLALLLGAVVSTFSRGTKGADLQLISSARDAGGLPSKGKDLIILAAFPKGLHVRIFNARGKKVEDSGEAKWKEKAEPIADLKEQLDGLWPPHELTRLEKDRAVAAVTSVVGHAEMRHRSGVELLGDLTRSMQESDPRLAGFRAGIAGSLWLLAMVTVFSIPVGVGAAVFLEEYTPPGWFRRTIQVNIANLAGVPSIVYGLLGLALFVDALGFKALAMGQSLWAGALTLGLLILPVIVIATQEALRTVPSSLRQAAMALGASRWQVVRDHVVPSAIPGILTGVILALSRAIGETAPLLMVGASASILFLPQGPSSEYTALPVEIYNYANEPFDQSQAAFAGPFQFQSVAAGGILLLLALLLTMNATAIVIRNRYARPSQG
jgi:phosphate transport system permease protein